MNISDESFPNDELLVSGGDGLEELASSIGERSSSSLMGHKEQFSSSMSGQSSSVGMSNHSQQTDKSSDESKGTTASDPAKASKSDSSGKYKKNKSQSYQDLHSQYTKKRYQHVKSKVREYIANIKEQDRQSRLKRMMRHRSLPETLSGYKALKENESSDGNNNNEQVASKEGCAEHECPSATMLQKQGEELKQLSTLNGYLQSNLDEKLLMLANLRRNADSMRIELMQMKDRERRVESQNRRLSLQSIVYRPACRLSTATQTDFHDDPKPHPSMILASLTPIRVLQSTPSLRQRSNSIPRSWANQSHHQPTANSVDLTKNGSDSAIESEVEIENDDVFNRATDNIVIYDRSTSTKMFNDSESEMRSKAYKKSRMRSIKNKFVWMLGPCTDCSRAKNGEREDYMYTQVPKSDSMFDLRF